MITKHDAMTASMFHENHEPAGKIYTWRRNGACKTWITRPDEFRLPVKYDLRSYDYITDTNAHMFHRADECPTRHVRVTMPDGAGEWYGILVSAARTRDSLAVVHVTTRGASKHRVGSLVSTDPAAITDL